MFCVDDEGSSRRGGWGSAVPGQIIFHRQYRLPGTKRLFFRSILCQADRPCACPLLSRYSCRCWAWFPFGPLTGIPEIRFLLVWGVASFPLGVRIAPPDFFSCFHAWCCMKRNLFLFSCQDAWALSGPRRGEPVPVLPVDTRSLPRTGRAVIKPVV